MASATTNPPVRMPTSTVGAYVLRTNLMRPAHAAENPARSRVRTPEVAAVSVVGLLMYIAGGVANLAPRGHEGGSRRSEPPEGREIVTPGEQGVSQTRTRAATHSRGYAPWLRSDPGEDRVRLRARRVGFALMLVSATISLVIIYCAWHGLHHL